MIIVISLFLERFIYFEVLLLVIMKMLGLIDTLKNYVIFDNKIVTYLIGKSMPYTNLFIHRLRKRGIIYKIEKNKYTLLSDPLLISSRLVWPAYISCWSALTYHKLTDQIVQDVTVITAVTKKEVIFKDTKIRFIKTKPELIFGYDKIKYNGSEIFIADLEKSIVDSALFKEVSFNEIRDMIKIHFREIDADKLIKYLQKVGNKTLIKRFGYLFDELGRDYYNKLKKYIDATYVVLNYSKSIKGKKNKKWRLIIND